jgi:hypothetical protein
MSRDEVWGTEDQLLAFPAEGLSSAKRNRMRKLPANVGPHTRHRGTCANELFPVPMSKPNRSSLAKLVLSCIINNLIIGKGQGVQPIENNQKFK